MKQDNVKGFIDENRDQFDDLEPNPEIWSKIKKSMVATGLYLPSTGKAGMLFKAASVKLIAAGTISAGLLAGAACYYIGAGNNGSIRPGTTRLKTQQYAPAIVALQQPDSSVTEVVNNGAKGAITPATQYTAPGQVPPVANAPVNNYPPPAAPVLSPPSPSVSVLNAGTAGRYYESSWKNENNKIDLNVDTLFSNIHHVRIYGNGFNWAITGTATNNVAMKASATTNDEGKSKNKADIFCTVKGDTLVIKARFTTPDNANNTNRHSLMQLAVPGNASIIAEEVCGNITAAQLAGNICDLSVDAGNVKAVHINKTATLSATTGNVLLDSSSGAFNARTRLGNVKMTNSGGTITATTNTGNILLEQFTGEVSGITGTGNVSFKGCGGKFNVTTNTGNCAVTNSSGQWEILTERGNIKASGMLLTGNASLTTRTGNISVQIDNPTADVSFDLHGGTGKISLNQNGKTITENSTLQTGNGKYKLISSVNTGNQEYTCNGQ
jgi:hypothetical protein